MPPNENLFMTNNFDPKDITILNQKIEPGENTLVKMNVGRLPSDTRISINAHVFRSGRPGPTVLISAGVHGDEINGIEIVRSSVYEGIFDNLFRGTVIAIPLVNVYGFINFSRDVSDGKDVNRSFPGSLKGSLAAQVARTLTKYVLPSVDIGLDFHTGGGSLYNHPQIRYSKKGADNLDLAKKFGPPYIIQKPLISKSLRKVGHDMGIPILVFEAGESLRLDGYAIETGKNGMLRLLHNLGMLEDAPSISFPQIHITKSSWLRADHSGLFMWTKRSGSFVKTGEPIGFYRDRDGTKQRRVYARKTGYVVGHNNAPVVNQGDALFHIGYEWEVIS